MVTQAPMKRALLIASPWGGLKGPLNDVKAMEELLRQFDFETTQLCGEEATRQGILAQWELLISKIETGDVVVVFYAGHGGLNEPSDIAPVGHGQGQITPPKRYQFIVPMDYKDDELESFRGILDVEISLLVSQMTEKTKNVTVIFDCCHSGRIARDFPHHSSAIPRALPKVDRKTLEGHMEVLLRAKEREILKHDTIEGNAHAVRIVAAADSEKAWEYNDHGKNVGIFTKALVSVLSETIQSNLTKMQPPGDLAVSWKMVFFRVQELVDYESYGQHPQVEGPYDRIIFSENTLSSTALPVTTEGRRVMIKAGQIAGVKVGNIYSLTPHTSHQFSEEDVICDAEVTDIGGFHAYLELPPGRHINEIPKAKALAYLKTEAPSTRAVGLSAELELYKPMLEASVFLKEETESNERSVIARIVLQGDELCLYSGRDIDQGVQCAAYDFTQEERRDEIMKSVIAVAEDLTRAHHMMHLEPLDDEKLEHKLEVTFRKIDGSSWDDTVRVGDSILINLENKGEHTIYVSVFDVNVLGEIFHISTASPDGIRLLAGSQYQLGQTQHARARQGLPISWPEALPTATRSPITETVVFLASSEAVDLRDFARKRPGAPRNMESQLERLAHRLAFGEYRNIGAQVNYNITRWNIICRSIEISQSSS